MFAQHTLQTRDVIDPTGTVATPADPESQPLPVGDDAIAFFASSVGMAYFSTGSPVSKAMATITCADASMTVRSSLSLPAGLSLSLAAGILSVIGTPTAAADVTITAYYMASDGSGRVRGTTTHRLVVLQSAQTLTIGSMQNPAGRVGSALDALLCAPSINGHASVHAQFNGANVPGVSIYLNWNPGSASSSGELRATGMPTAEGAYSLSCDFYRAGAYLGRSTHTLTIGPSYQATPSPGAPTAGPTPTAPVAGTDSGADTVGGQGPDPLLSSVIYIARFNSAPSMHHTLGGRVSFDPPNYSPARTAGLEGQALVMSSDTAIDPGITWFRGRIAEADSMPPSFTVECFTRPDMDCLGRLLAVNGRAFAPVMSCGGSRGAHWLLGLLADFYETAVGPLGRRVFAALILRDGLDLERYTIFRARDLTLLLPTAGFLHLAGSRWTNGADVRAGAWLDGQGGDVPIPLSPGYDPGTDGRQDYGTGIGTAMGAQWSRRALPDGRPMQLLRYTGAIDEARYTAAARYSAYMQSGYNTEIPAAMRRAPWPNR